MEVRRLLGQPREKAFRDEWKGGLDIFPDNTGVVSLDNVPSKNLRRSYRRYRWLHGPRVESPRFADRDLSRPRWRASCDVRAKNVQKSMRYSSILTPGAILYPPVSNINRARSWTLINGTAPIKEVARRDVSDGTTDRSRAHTFRKVCSPVKKPGEVADGTNRETI